MSPRDDIQQRASTYAARRHLRLERSLGYGKDGTVFQTDRPSAVKVFFRPDVYARERACYERLAEHQVIEVRGHHVPQLVGWDDQALAIEMTIVQRPYLLDFADAMLDTAPDFTDEVLEEWHRDKEAEFGERWDDVQLVLATLRGRYRIHLLDVNPANIAFADPREPNATA